MYVYAIQWFCVTWYMNQSAYERKLNYLQLNGITNTG